MRSGVVLRGESAESTELRVDRGGSAVHFNGGSGGTAARATGSQDMGQPSVAPSTGNGTNPAKERYDSGSMNTFFRNRVRVAHIDVGDHSEGQILLGNIILRGHIDVAPSVDRDWLVLRGNRVMDGADDTESSLPASLYRDRIPAELGVVRTGLALTRR